MNREELIETMECLGFQHNESYCTCDKCFDYEGCKCYPLVFHGWEQVEAFVNTIHTHQERN